MENNSNLAGAIDLGTNSFRLLIAEVKGAEFNPLAKELLVPRLGEDLGKTGKLTPAAVARAISSINKFVRIIKRYPPMPLRVCGTAALRAAANSAEFIKEAEKVLDNKIEVISPTIEAALSMKGCLAGVGRRQGPICLVDAGGGSTEIIIAPSSPAMSDQSAVTDPLFSISVPAGAVSLTEEFLTDSPRGSGNIQRLENHLQGAVRQALDQLNRELGLTGNNNSLAAQGYLLVGTGGTATGLAALDLGLDRYDEDLIQGHVISLSRLRQVVGRVSRLSVDQRNRLPGLDRGRGEIILAGLKIYEVILLAGGFGEILISDTGLLEGLLLAKAVPGCC